MRAFRFVAFAMPLAATFFVPSVASAHRIKQGEVNGDVISSALALKREASDISSRFRPCMVNASTRRLELRVSAPARLDDSTLIVHVCVYRPQGTARLGSYHFELYYDSTSIVMASSVGASSGLRVDNARVRGRVSFAGADTNGFSDGLVETVKFRVKKGSLPALALKVVEAYSTKGTPLNPTVIVAGAALSIPAPAR